MPISHFSTLGGTSPDAPDAMVYSVKVLDSGGSGWDSNIIAGLEEVLNTDASVVNISLGREGDCLVAANDPGAALMRTAFANLVSAGVTIVVAAGNDRGKEVQDMVPAGCPEVIAVASTTAEPGNNRCKFLPGRIEADTASFFTTDGAMDDDGVGVTISAPGESKEDNTCGTIQSKGIESLAMGGGTTEKSGTSMASPHVAGVVALMLQDTPALTPQNIRAALIAGADRAEIAPLDHPYISESLDGELEGVVYAPNLINEPE